MNADAAGADDIRSFILRELAQGRGIGSIEPGDDLLGLGIVDSLGIVQLVAFLEERFGVSISDEDLQPENFGTIADIEAFVARKAGAGP